MIEQGVLLESLTQAPVSLGKCDLTPIEMRDGIWFKRDDLFEVCGLHGSKARQALQIISNGEQGTVVTCGARQSPQIKIVARICKSLGKRCVCFTLPGPLTKELESAIADGAEIIQCKDWLYNNVIAYHSRKYAAEREYLYVPFGMESWGAVQSVANQTQNVPDFVERIVIIAGSGINLCGVLWGLKLQGFGTKVLAVRVGHDFSKTLAKYGPRDLSNLEIVKSELTYQQTPKQTELCGVQLDEIYESKAIPFVRKGDLLWVIGRR